MINLGYVQKNFSFDFATLESLLPTIIVLEIAELLTK